MKEMRKKQIKHRCSIPGCKNIRTTLFSRSRDWSRSVYLCDDCISSICGSTPAQSVCESAKAEELLRKFAMLNSMTVGDLTDICAVFGLTPPPEATKEILRRLILGDSVVDALREAERARILGAVQ